MVYKNLLNLVISSIIIFCSFIGFFRINFFYLKKDIILKIRIFFKKKKNQDLIKDKEIYISKNGENNKYPLISIIIPVRNEEKRIGILLEDLMNQSFKPLEIIVVDDGSQDNTIKLVEEFISKKNEIIDFKLKYFSIDKTFDKQVDNNNTQKSDEDINEPLKNWEGKAAACYFGAMKAKGDFFLFFDADVRLAEDALKYISEILSEDLVSCIIPYHLTFKEFEQFSLYPNLVVFLGLDIGKIKNPYETKAGLFGPCLIIPKSIYYKTGGHFLVKGTLLDDMALGIELSKRKIKIACFPHRNKIFFNMYPEGFKVLIDGWTKNMITGAQKSTFWTVLIIFSFITYSSTIAINIILSALNKNYTIFFSYIIQYLIFSFLLYFSSKKLGNFKLWASLTYPIFVLFYLFIFIRSFIMKILKIPINWRGRKIIIK